MFKKCPPLTHKKNNNNLSSNPLSNILDCIQMYVDKSRLYWKLSASDIDQIKSTEWKSFSNDVLSLKRHPSNIIKRQIYESLVWNTINLKYIDTYLGNLLFFIGRLAFLRQSGTSAIIMSRQSIYQYRFMSHNLFNVFLLWSYNTWHAMNKDRCPQILSDYKLFELYFYNIYDTLLKLFVDLLEM